MSKPKAVPKPPSPFTLNDRALITEDADFWLKAMQGFIEAYRTSTVDTESRARLRAIACGRLAGFALSMHANFCSAVESLGFDKDAGCLDAGVASFELGEAHAERLFTKSLSRLN